MDATVKWLSAMWCRVVLEACASGDVGGPLLGYSMSVKAPAVGSVSILDVCGREQSWAVRFLYSVLADLFVPIGMPMGGVLRHCQCLDLALKAGSSVRLSAWAYCSMNAAMGWLSGRSGAVLWYQLLKQISG